MRLARHTLAFFASFALLASPAHAVETLSGTIVKAADSTPLAGIDLDAYDVATGLAVSIGMAASDGAGNYTLTLPGPGTYFLRADAGAMDGVADQYYGNTFLRSASQTISVAANQAITGVDFALPEGFTLSGTVLGSGVPLAGIDLDVFTATGEFLSGYSGTTAVDGTFTVGALPPGSYRMSADPSPALGQFFVEAFFDAAPEEALATPIAVGTQNLVGFDFDLIPGGSLSGFVTAASDATPIHDVDIDLLDAFGNRTQVNARTDLNGHYQIGSVPPGEYSLRVDPTIAQGFARTYYPNAATEAAATLVTVSAGLDTPGVDVALGLGALIGGTIVEAGSAIPVAGVDLDLFDAMGRRADFTSKSAADGSYRLGPMMAGSYLLRADPSILQGYAREYYAAAATEAAATLVIVSAGEDHTGVDFALSPGATIGGTIRDALSLAPIEGVDLDVFDATGSLTGFSAASAANGAYRLGPMLPGTYFVRADPASPQGYAALFDGGAIDLNLASGIAVALGADVTGVDFELNPAGGISGLILGSLSAPVPGIDLDLYEAVTGVRLRRSEASAAQGTYSFDALNPGPYKLRADSTLAQGYALQYYDRQVRKAVADLVVVAGSSPTPNIDFRLEPGGTLSGTVTEAVSGLPVSGMDIDLLRAGDLMRFDQSAKTDANGDYTLTGVPAGDYLVRADPAPAQPYRRTYYGGAVTASSATQVTVASGQAVPAISIAVPEPAAAASRIVALAALCVLVARRRKATRRPR